jgi:hypothetical protein
VLGRKGGGVTKFAARRGRMSKARGRKIQIIWRESKARGSEIQASFFRVSGLFKSFLTLEKHPRHSERGPNQSENPDDIDRQHTLV